LGNIEDISELFYLLNFFSKPYVEQWERMPDRFEPVWIDGDSCHCNVYSPIFFLLCIFADSVGSVDKSFRLNQETVNILEDEVYTLVEYWMLDRSNDELFSRGNEDLFIGRSQIKIWLLLSRLCKLALSYEDLGKYQLRDLSFEHFLEKYAYPFDRSV
jgi:hypothetical protein